MGISLSTAIIVIQKLIPVKRFCVTIMLIKVEVQTMQENDETESNAQEAKNRHRNPFRAAQALFKRLPIGLRFVIAGALTCFAAIVAIAVFHPSLNERWKFGTDMTLNLLILLVIAVQAFIYNKQGGTMERQWEEIKGQAEKLFEN
ncbi:MAG: hypothetical protein WCF57_09040 [Pyrinomonadaceae bacterium]